MFNTPYNEEQPSNKGETNEHRIQDRTRSSNRIGKRRHRRKCVHLESSEVAVSYPMRPRSKPTRV